MVHPKQAKLCASSEVSDTGVGAAAEPASFSGSGSASAASGAEAAVHESCGECSASAPPPALEALIFTCGTLRLLASAHTRAHPQQRSGRTHSPSDAASPEGELSNARSQQSQSRAAQPRLDVALECVRLGTIEALAALTHMLLNTVNAFVGDFVE